MNNIDSINNLLNLKETILWCKFNTHYIPIIYTYYTANNIVLLQIHPIFY